MTLLPACDEITLPEPVIARLSADGKLYTCLFASSGHDLRELIRGGQDDRALARRVADIWRARRDRYSAERASAEAMGSPAMPMHPVGREARDAKVEMSYIGG